MRILTLVYSIRNEKRLKSNGGIEYGKLNTIILAFLHFVFYISSITEAIINKSTFDFINLIGLVLYLFSYAMLIIVIYNLKTIWTVKLIIAKEHTINKNLLFKYIRHPNYFLNVIPELIAITLICKSYYTFVFVFPFYIISLIVRIIQEEKIMKQSFTNY
ncbi:MAG: hypothetical protein A2086_10385 [Spirochaetes bacterium GWD1_27_9]|nr:MAG: hypothetical protein A2Z98_03600 [Spirochaetes bacterium GWB1_27_13]OHD22965.1 MAG: hypothetical protein A2Y34_00980 [Spirochaetes bacterium GWC1_27_15]OHD43704.1 MAG: hypothetical protein A2086_10385 [Spirochaetes bacterium GWD1_27_9]